MMQWGPLLLRAPAARLLYINGCSPKGYKKCMSAYKAANNGRTSYGRVQEK